MKKYIDSSEISVIVRGLIVGKKEDEPLSRYTKRSLESIRKILPDAQIILSSWEGSDVTDLIYDNIILSKEPEKIFMLSSENIPKLMTVNNQIKATQAGLKLATRPYVISMRSDIIIEKRTFLKYFKKYSKNMSPDILEKPILTLPTYNPKKQSFLFDICDWFYFGTKKDIAELFSIPLMEESKLRGEKINGLYLIKNNLESEQYIWINFLNTHGYSIKLLNINYIDSALLKLCEKTYGLYTIMIPAHLAGIKCLKMPKAGYSARPWLSQGLYTFNEYKRLRNKYSDKKVFIFPNFIEDFFYNLSTFTRKTIKNKLPRFYKHIVNMIRRLNGSSNLLK